MATVIEQIEANIAKATTKLAQDRAVLAQMRAAVPALKERKDQLNTSLGIAVYQASLAVDRYIRAKDTFRGGDLPGGWIRSPENVSWYNSTGGKPIAAALANADALAKVRDAEFAKWAAADRDWKAADAKMNAAFNAEADGLRNITNLNASLAKERAKPDPAVARAAAQVVLNTATATYTAAKQKTTNARAASKALEAKVTSTKAAYTLARTNTLKAQGVYNALKIKVPKVRPASFVVVPGPTPVMQLQPMSAASSAYDLAKQKADAALTVLNAAIAVELAANNLYKAATAEKLLADTWLNAFIKAEAGAKNAELVAKAALAKIK